jgi:hypothetical protein
METHSLDQQSVDLHPVSDDLQIQRKLSVAVPKIRHPGLSRRNFLRVATLGVAGWLLNACSPVAEGAINLCHQQGLFREDCSAWWKSPNGNALDYEGEAAIRFAELFGLGTQIDSQNPLHVGAVESTRQQVGNDDVNTTKIEGSQTQDGTGRVQIYKIDLSGGKFAYSPMGFYRECEGGEWQTAIDESTQTLWYPAQGLMAELQSHPNASATDITELYLKWKAGLKGVEPTYIVSKPVGQPASR